MGVRTRAPDRHALRVAMLQALGIMFGGGLVAVGTPAAAGPLEMGRPNERPPGVQVLSVKSYDGVTDDLLTAGLGADGLAGALPAVNDPPTPAQQRRLAIWANYRAVLDITADGGYGRFYGPNVRPDGTVTTDPGRIAGTEVLAYADHNKAGGPNVTMMVQVPVTFDPARPCIVAAPSSGSRGVYGAIGTAGEWGLKHGCAVAYTDKGTGNGLHDLSANTVGLFDGTRADAAVADGAATFRAPLTEAQRILFAADHPYRIAAKHAHSQRNPEASWGRDTLDAVRFAYWVLNEQYGTDGRRADGTPCRNQRFTPRNTIVIASGISNGGGAALAAAEQDDAGLIDGVAVAEPQVQVDRRRQVSIASGGTVYTGGARPLIDYFTFANLYQPCTVFVPIHRFYVVELQDLTPGDLAKAKVRCARMQALGLMDGATDEARTTDALARLHAYGYLPDSDTWHATHWGRATTSIVATYANAYGRFSVRDRLCGLSFAATDAATGQPVAWLPALAAVSCGVGNGVPPTVNVNIVNDAALGGPTLDVTSTSAVTGQQDMGLDAALCMRALWTGTGFDALRVKLGAAQVQRKADLGGKPAIIVHGRSDTLVPVNFSSRPYYARNLQVEGRRSRLRYVEVTHAQHFDAFIPVYFNYANLLVPLHVYYVRALDAMWAHLTAGTPLPPSQVVPTTTRGYASLGRTPPLADANIPPIDPAPPAERRITFDGTTLVVP